MSIRLVVPSFLRKVQWKSFAAGAVLAVFSLGCVQTAGAFDFAAAANSVANLVKIKKNLDGDVKSLSGDAKTLYGDKDNLLQIKDQLIKLSTETQAQIESINKLVGTVEGHVKTTQGDIAKTSQHVNEIDDVRKALQGG